jgi:hypothetical protein
VSVHAWRKNAKKRKSVFAGRSDAANTPHPATSRDRISEKPGTPLPARVHGA